MKKDKVKRTIMLGNDPVKIVSIRLPLIRMVLFITAYVLRLCAGGILEFLLPGTFAKFIIKSSLFALSLDKGFPARNRC